jgi:hypothetical protein
VEPATLRPADGAGRPLTITSSLPNPPRSRSRASLFAIAATLALLAVGSAPASAANVLPDAGFGVFPRDPVSGETVRFVSYACDPDGSIAELAWDLDNDGSWDDAVGRAAQRAFPAGSHWVSLRATDSSGAQSVKSRLVSVVPGSLEYVVPRLFTPPLLSPFPVVRLAGRLIEPGARIDVLTIRAPVCSRVTVRCQGTKCPVRRVTRLMGRKALHIRAIEGRTLSAGTRLEVLVTKRHRVGKYTRFRIRRGESPRRFDTCLRYRATRGSACPAG